MTDDRSTSTTPSGNGGHSSDAVQRVTSFISRLSLQDVRFTKLHAELLAEEPAAVGEAYVTRSIQYSLRDGLFRNTLRFNVRLDPSDATPDGDATVSHLADIEVEVVVEFLLAPGAEPDDELIQLFIQQNTIFMVYPYFREAVQSLSSRLGLDKFVFGLWLFDSAEPTVAVAVSSPTSRTSS